MELIRRNHNWDPFSVLDEFQKDLNRAFDHSLAKRGDWHGRFIPEVDVTEESDRYVLHADLPGLVKEDVSISVQGNVLTLRGERKGKVEKTEKNTYYSERSFGSFSRSMEFPTEIQAEKVNASYENGVLKVDLPKAESAKPKQIDIQVK